MGSAIGWIISKTGWSERTARAVAHVALVLIVLAAAGGAIAWIRHDAVSDHQATIERRAAPATDQAAAERAQDTIATATHEQELHNVIAAQPDQPIAPSSRALACRRLHDAGRDPPACRGPSGGG